MPLYAGSYIECPAVKVRLPAALPLSKVGCAEELPHPAWSTAGTLPPIWVDDQVETLQQHDSRSMSHLYRRVSG
jgi:hypothetical protein